MKVLSLTPVLVLSLSLALVGCVSPGFEREWRKAGLCKGSSGERWEGRWESKRVGVGGPMRAVLRPDADGHVQAYFEARWKCFLTAYKVTLNSKIHKGARLLSGEQMLDSFVGGGIYKYEGTLTDQELKAAYDSHHDKGTFHLEPSAVLHPPCTCLLYTSPSPRDV
jgi:hypothetical protein